MNITTENIDELNAVIQVNLESSDYADRVQNVLQEYRKKAKVDGFRPGKVPFGLVKKLYGQAVLADEINKLLSEHLNTYIKENDLRILGEPIPSEDSPRIDWEKQEDFLFRFDIGLSPELEINLTKRDKVTLYQIEVTEKMINQQVENFSRRFGSFQPTDKAGPEDLIKAELVQLDDQGEPLVDGIRSEESMISLMSVDDQELKNELTGKGATDQIQVDILKLFPNETDRATALKIEKSAVEKATGSFLLTVNEVSHFEPAGVDQELFDKAFGEGQVTTEDEFRQKIREGMESQLAQDSRYRFHLDAKEKLQKKIEVNLPDAFLKRWMLMSNQENELTEEQLEEEYPIFAEDLKWQLIKSKIIQDQDLKAEEEEIKQHAVQYAYSQYQQYGMTQVPNEQLARFAESILQDEKEQRRLIERILENKVIDHIQAQVKLDEKKIALEDFQKLFD